jgi:hypothetical protein
MKKIIYLLALMLLHASGAFAQSTTVSGTITDSGSQAWFAGTIQFLFRPAASNPSAQYMWNGAPFSSSSTFPQNPLSLDSTGSFSGLSIPSNTAIAPAGSQWAVTVCPAATVPNCYTQLLTITGSTQNISSQVIPPPVVVNFSVPLLGARAYTDAEVVGASPGALYFNVTDNTIHVCEQAGFPPCNWISQQANPTPFFNGATYVGGANAAFWGGGDIGAQIMAAYAATPAWGGTIYELPPTNGSCYTWTTQINFSTKGKYIKLAGVSPPSFAGVASTEQGQCMNWTSTAAGPAMIIDWTNTGGAGNTPGGGIENITFWNNQCATNGGCGSSASGLSIGPVNGGAMSASFRNVKWRGFGSGLLFPANSAQLNFTLYFENFSLQQNTTAVSNLQASEGLRFTTGVILQNGTAWNQTAGPGGMQVEFDDVHWDSNTVGITGNCAGNWTLVGNHFENLGGVSTHYISCAGTGDFFFQGGFAGDDNATSNTDFWFNAFAFGGNLSIFSAGETATNVFSAGGMNCMTVANGSTTVLPGVPNGFSCNTSATLNRINQPSATPMAQVVTCSGGTRSIVYSPAFNSTPVVFLFDYSTKGGISLTSTSATGFTASCTGAGDTFSWTAIGNPN